MNEGDKAVVRACLDQVLLAMVEAREVRAWWDRVSEEHRREWKDFAALVIAYRGDLSE